MPKEKYKRRKDGRKYSYIVVGRKENGKPDRKGAYGYTDNEVDEQLAEIRYKYQKGVLANDKGLTFGEWSLEWLKTYKIDVQHSTLQMYKNCINKYIIPVPSDKESPKSKKEKTLPLLGGIKIKNLKLHNLQAALNEIVAAGHSRAAEIFKLTVTQILEQAEITDIIGKNPAKGLKYTKPMKPPKRALTDTEKTDIMNLPLPDMIKVFIGIMLYCGLRRGEAWALTKTDIVGDCESINVCKTVHFEDGAKSKDRTKTYSGFRTIPIPEPLRDILRPYIHQLKTVLLFTNTDGTLMTEKVFRLMWGDFITMYNASKGGTDKLKIIASDITPHIFRHTYCTMLYYAGVDIKTAQYLMGHSTIQVTLSIYTHLQKGQDKKALNQLNIFLGRQQDVSKENAASE